MSTSYRGLFLIGPSELPTDVQVVDPGGNSIPLSISEYVSRGVLPKWCSLPTDKQYRMLVAIKSLEAGVSSVINRDDAEACFDKGWVDISKGGDWVLTVLGKECLE